MYKLPTNTSSVPGNAEEGAFHQTDLRDIGKVLETIGNQLSSMWDTFGHFKRIVKRLVLYWHPDRHQNEAELCEKIFYHFDRCMFCLERGWHMPSYPYKKTHNMDTSYTSFLNKIYSRGKALCRRQSNTISEPRPQPEEGRCWLRQAQTDLQAAKVTRQQGDVGGGIYNWACIQAYEVTATVFCFCHSNGAKKTVKEFISHSHRAT